MRNLLGWQKLNQPYLFAGLHLNVETADLGVPHLATFFGELMKKFAKASEEDRLFLSQNRLLDINHLVQAACPWSRLHATAREAPMPAPPVDPDLISCSLFEYIRGMLRDGTRLPLLRIDGTGAITTVSLGKVTNDPYWCNYDPRTKTFLFVRGVLEAMYPKVSQARLEKFIDQGVVEGVHAISDILHVCLHSRVAFDYVRASMSLIFGGNYFSEHLQRCNIARSDQAARQVRADTEARVLQLEPTALPFDVGTVVLQVRSLFPHCGVNAGAAIALWLMQKPEVQLALSFGNDRRCYAMLQDICAVNASDMAKKVRCDITANEVFLGISHEWTMHKPPGMPIDDALIGGIVVGFVGPPGTGKTSIIANIFDESVRCGESPRTLQPGKMSLVVCTTKAEVAAVMSALSDVGSGKLVVVTWELYAASTQIKNASGLSRWDIMASDPGLCSGNVHVTVVTCIASLVPLFCSKRHVERVVREYKGGKHLLGFGNHFIMLPSNLALVWLSEFQMLVQFVNSDLVPPAERELVWDVLTQVAQSASTCIWDGELSTITMLAAADLGRNTRIHVLVPERRGPNITLHETSRTFLAQLVSVLNKMEPLLVVCDSAAMVAELAAELPKLTARTVMGFTSGMSNDERGYFQNLDGLLQQLVVVVSSPVMTVATDLKTRSAVFGAFCGQTVSANVALQMMSRVRNFTSDGMHVFFSGHSPRMSLQPPLRRNLDEILQVALKCLAKPATDGFILEFANAPEFAADLGQMFLDNRAVALMESFDTASPAIAFKLLSAGVLGGFGPDRTQLSTSGMTAGDIDNVVAAGSSGLDPLSNTYPSWTRSCKCGVMVADVCSVGLAVCGVCGHKSMALRVFKFCHRTPFRQPAVNYPQILQQFANGELYTHNDTSGRTGLVQKFSLPDLARFLEVLQHGVNRDVRWLPQFVSRCLANFSKVDVLSLPVGGVTLPAGGDALATKLADGIKADMLGTTLAGFTDLNLLQLDRLGLLRELLGGDSDHTRDQAKMAMQLAAITTALGLPFNQATLENLATESQLSLALRFPGCYIVKSHSFYVSLLRLVGYPQNLELWVRAVTFVCIGQSPRRYNAGAMADVLDELMVRKFQLLVAMLSDVAKRSQVLNGPFLLDFGRMSFAGVDLLARLSDLASDADKARRVLEEVGCGVAALGLKTVLNPSLMTVADGIDLLKQMARVGFGMALKFSKKDSELFWVPAYLALRTTALYLRLLRDPPTFAQDVHNTLVSFLKRSCINMPVEWRVLLTVANVTLPVDATPAPATMPRTASVQSSQHEPDSLPSTQPYNHDTGSGVLSQPTKTQLKLLRAFMASVIAKHAAAQQGFPNELYLNVWLVLTDEDRTLVVDRNANVRAVLSLKFRLGKIVTEVLENYSASDKQPRGSVIQQCLERMKVLQRAESLCGLSDADDAYAYARTGAVAESDLSEDERGKDWDELAEEAAKDDAEADARSDCPFLDEAIESDAETPDFPKGKRKRDSDSDSETASE